MTKRSQRPSVQISTYGQAATILNEYEETRSHLQSLVESFIPNGGLIVNTADIDYLKHCGRTIKGVAERFFKDNKLLNKIKTLSQITNEAERELTDERICIQLEEQGMPKSCKEYLIKQYDKAKTK